MLLRFTCPRGTQFGGLDEGRGRVGASSLAIALAVSLRLPASALMALCLLFRGGGVLCSSLGTLMRVSRPVCLETRCDCPGRFVAVPRAEELVTRKAGALVPDIER